MSGKENRLGDLTEEELHQQMQEHIERTQGYGGFGPTIFPEKKLEIEEQKPTENKPQDPITPE